MNSFSSSYFAASVILPYPWTETDTTSLDHIFAAAIAKYSGQWNVTLWLCQKTDGSPLLIDSAQFEEHVRIIESGKVKALSFDFETDGLSAYHGNKAFIMGVAYLDQKFAIWTSDIPKDGMARLCGLSHVTYCAHNAKYELAFLRRQFGVEVKGRTWDTEVFARIEHFDQTWKYSEQECAKRIGLTKYPPMLEWLNKKEGSKKPNRERYHAAPPELIVPYVTEDAAVCLKLREHQLKVFLDWENNSSVPIFKLLKLENKTTQNLFEMEDYGLLVDVQYVKDAITYEKNRAAEALVAFNNRTGATLVHSAKCLKPIFDELGLSYGKTDDGNPSFDEASLLPNKGHPVVQAILTARNASKRAKAYFGNFLALQVDGVIHPNIRQCKITGRFSIAEPSAQNWTADDEDDLAPGETFTPYPIRKAFIARPGCYIVSMDYAQMEYRFLIDAAEDMRAISQVKNGEDVHSKRAALVGVSRGKAKNAVFAKLYGAGVKKLALMLGVSEELAKRLADAIDSDAPLVTEFCRDLIKYAKRAGFGNNFMGRRYFFEKGFEYKMPDYYTQGGCSEVLRIAINDITEFLRTTAKGNTRIMLPVHDELVLNVDEVDLQLLPEIKRLMISAHKHLHLPMDVSVAIGPNYHDLKELKL